jgi:hypothetical protein
LGGMRRVRGRFFRPDYDYSLSNRREECEGSS